MNVVVIGFCKPFYKKNNKKTLKILSNKEIGYYP